MSGEKLKEAANRKQRRMEVLVKQRHELADEAVLSLRAIMVTLREERGAMGPQWNEILTERMGSLKVAIKLAEQQGDL